MSCTRRRFLHLAAGAAALPLLPTGIALGQNYPTRPVHVLVGYTAGGAVDILARLVGNQLSERLGVPFVIENRPGAGSNIATEILVRAAPDGQTLLLANTSSAINATLYDKLNFNFIRDVAPVGAIMRGPFIVEVPPSFPAKTLPELIAYAKNNPGKISCGSSGTGASDHMASELFKMMTGVDMVHVAYRGAAPALIDLLAGQVQVMFASMPASIGYVRAGKLRALAVTTKTRSDALPDVPSVSEFVPGYEASGWYGVVAPKRTPAAVVQELNHEINAVLANDKIKSRLAELGGHSLPGSPDEFAKLITDETEKWRRVIQTGHIKVG